MLACLAISADANAAQTEVRSPDGRNVIVLEVTADRHIRYSVERDGNAIIRPSLICPVLAEDQTLGTGARIIDLRRDEIHEQFSLPCGKTSEVTNHCRYAVVRLNTDSNVEWDVEIRAGDDGVAFRYRITRQQDLDTIELQNEATQFDVAEGSTALFNTLASFTTGHESLYEHKSLAKIPARRLLDMPILLTWRDGPAAAITEARVRGFSGAYLQRESSDATTLRCRLSPLPANPSVSVIGNAPLTSPWRVVMLADVAGQLLESNLLQCLNDPQQGEFNWLRAGKTTWHWWYGEFEDDYQIPPGTSSSFDRHCTYIDFCARNKIAYHAVSGDGFAWYKQSRKGYETPAQDVDILTPRAEIQLPRIIAYAAERDVGIRLWVHWKPLSEHQEEAFTLYESWGVKGLMVEVQWRTKDFSAPVQPRRCIESGELQMGRRLHPGSQR